MYPYPWSRQILHVLYEWKAAMLLLCAWRCGCWCVVVTLMSVRLDILADAKHVIVRHPMTIQIWREIFLLASNNVNWWKNLYFGLYSPRVYRWHVTCTWCVGGRRQVWWLLSSHTLVFSWKAGWSFYISSISIFVSNLFSFSGSTPWHIGYEILNVSILWWVEPFSTNDAHMARIETNDEFYFKHDEHPHILWGVVKPYFQLILLMLRFLCDLQKFWCFTFSGWLHTNYSLVSWLTFIHFGHENRMRTGSGHGKISLPPPPAFSRL